MLKKWVECLICALFSYCFSLTSMPDISKWNTKNLNNISVMFQNCLSLSFLPNISKWNVLKESDLIRYSHNIINIPSI